MTPRTGILALWLIAGAAAAWIVAGTRYITDLSAFLPSQPTPMQRLLVDQLREGPASRLLLVALEEGRPELRARLASALAGRLRADPAFSRVDDGERLSDARDRDFLLQHRYVLSDAVCADHFAAAGLKPAIEDTLQSLATPAGLLLKSLVPRDPTGEMLHILDRSMGGEVPRVTDGVWSSADGTRALLAVQTSAAGSDTDAQEHDIARIRTAFRNAQAAVGPSSSVVRLRMSGPGVFAVAARARIKQAATRLSIISGLLVTGVLFAVYRSPRALVLGLLPVATGALAGVAAVALGFGAVHGITLGFGVTLIGESVDYAVYFFIRSAEGAWRRSLWPTVRLGMFTSVCGFASLLPSRFPGLAQLGLYSIGGLMAAALVTRFVLPELVPAGFAVRDVTPLGLRLGRVRHAVLRRGKAAAAAAALLMLAAVAVLHGHRDTLWNRELSALSPVPASDQQYDARLRADLGAADLRSIVVVNGPDLESVLRGAERAGTALQSLVDGQIIGGFETPAAFLPSRAAQEERRRALPDESTLRDALRQALAGLALDAGRLEPFVRDVQAARNAAPLTAEDLRGTSFAAAFDALVLHASGQWSALLPVHAAEGAGSRDVDAARLGVAMARVAGAHVLDMKTEMDALYAGYLQEAIRLSLAGGACIVLLLLAALRSTARVVRVLTPLLLAVITVAAALALGGIRLTLLHLVGMLLIVAVGSNYALFFDAADARRGGTSPPLLASLCIANVSTVIAFGVLSMSHIPILEALGMTVAPGTFLALVFSAVLVGYGPDGSGA